MESLNVYCACVSFIHLDDRLCSSGGVQHGVTPMGLSRLELCKQIIVVSGSRACA